MFSCSARIDHFVAAELSNMQWREWHRFRRQRAREVDPSDPLLSDAEAEADALKPSGHWDNRWFVALDGDAVIGTASVGFRRRGSPREVEHARHLGGGGFVLTGARRRGIGTMLLEQMRQVMHALDKSVLSLSAHADAGHAFLHRAGAVARHSGVQNRAWFDQLDWRQLQEWEDGVQGLGLSWERYALRVPEARLEALLPEFTRLIVDMPMGELDRPPIRFEMQGYREWYESIDRTGGAHHVLVLRDSGGLVVGLTETGWDARMPDRVWQQLTATDPAWRGRGVARALKAAMFRQVREHHPGVAVMITSNAEVNAPMLSINRRVGFKVHRRTVDYQVSRDALDAWAASLAR